MKIVTGIVIFVVACVSWAQEEKELTPRELFLLKVPAAAKPTPTQVKTPVAKPKTVAESSPAKAVSEPQIAPVAVKKTPNGDGETPFMKAAYTPLALRYSLLQKKGTGYVEVDADTEFHTGDHIRVRVETNDNAFLYIVMGGSSGQWRVIFPDKDIDHGNNKIEKGHACTIPPENDAAFAFDGPEGVEKVSLILSRSPEPDLEKLIYAAGDPTRNDGQPKRMIAMNTIDESAITQLEGKLKSRDLVFQKYDGPAEDGKQDKAVYAATRDKSPDAKLFVDLKLTHK
jgi:hypothetical protein